MDGIVQQTIGDSMGFIALGLIFLFCVEWLIVMITEVNE